MHFDASDVPWFVLVGVVLGWGGAWLWISTRRRHRLETLVAAQFADGLNERVYQGCRTGATYAEALQEFEDSSGRQILTAELRHAGMSARLTVEDVERLMGNG
jgi:hypothetical protein